MPGASPAIQTFNLTKLYPGKRGIRNINLTVKRGEIFGFLGPNGAGKSTTQRTLLGFLRPTSGRAEVLGRNVATDTVEIHRAIGNLPSEFSLEDRMTALELLRFYADLRGSGEASVRRAHELAERLNADLHVPMRRLSRGNKQKIGIIQAFFHDPSLILLDEPTGGLDPLMRDAFLALLREARDRGQTIFFSSHILSEVEQVADRVGIIRGGELVAVEDPGALTDRAWRNVRIQFAQPLGDADIAAFRNAPGVERLDVHGPILTFRASAAMNEVLRLTSQHEVRSFDAERPPLEEIFLSYYGEARS